MQLVTLDSREVAGRPGVLLPDGDGILDLVAAPTTLRESDWIPRSVVSILAAGEDGEERVLRLLDAALARRAELRAAGILLPLAGTPLLTPIRRPGLVLAAAELPTLQGEPAPVAAVLSPNTVAGPDARVLRPPAAAGGEVRALPVLVVGRELGPGATPAQAERAIGALTLMLSFAGPRPTEAGGLASWRGWLDSRQFPGACPVGPALVTRAGLGPAASVSLAVNGIAAGEQPVALEQAASLLAALAARHAFRPGDLVACGPGIVVGGDGARGPVAGDRLAARLGDLMTLDCRVEA